LGNARGIELPDALLDNLGLKEKDAVDIKVEDDYIIIKKSAKSVKLLRNGLKNFMVWTLKWL